MTLSLLPHIVRDRGARSDSPGRRAPFLEISLKHVRLAMKKAEQQEYVLCTRCHALSVRDPQVLREQGCKTCGFGVLIPTRSERCTQCKGKVYHVPAGAQKWICPQGHRHRTGFMSRLVTAVRPYLWF